MRSKLSEILVTGGAGFIGSEFVRQCARKKYKITVLDSLSYAGDLARLQEVKGNIKFIKADIVNTNRLDQIFKKVKPQRVVHFAAETHVDRSIKDATPFIKTNVIGTQNLIDISRKYKVKKFVHISTDEIYGQSVSGYFIESDPLNAKNPYSATKAAAEQLINAAVHTYDFPATIVRPANNYGPWQYPEKFVPVIIMKAIKNKKVPVYGKGKQIREWLFVSDCATAILKILNKGKVGEIYNIGTNFEQNNLKTAKMILTAMKKPHSLIQFVQDRPGHDFRYSVNCSKLKNLGWKRQINFSEGMRKTIEWHDEHRDWMKDKQKLLESYWKSVYKT